MGTPQSLGQPVPVCDHPHSKKVYVYMGFLVFQFVPRASHHVAGHYREEPGAVFFTPSHPIFTHIDKISLETSLLLAEPSQLSQFLSVWQMLQSLKLTLGTFTGYTLQYVHVLLVLGSPDNYFFSIYFPFLFTEISKYLFLGIQTLLIISEHIRFTLI